MAKEFIEAKARTMPMKDETMMSRLHKYSQRGGFIFKARRRLSLDFCTIFTASFNYVAELYNQKYLLILFSPEEEKPIL